MHHITHKEIKVTTTTNQNSLPGPPGPAPPGRAAGLVDIKRIKKLIELAM